MKLIKVNNYYYNVDTLIGFCCVNDAIFLDIKNCSYATKIGRNTHFYIEGSTTFFKLCLVGNDINSINAIFQKFVDFLTGNNDDVFDFNCVDYPFEEEPSADSAERGRNIRIRNQYGSPTYLGKINNIKTGEEC